MREINLALLLHKSIIFVLLLVVLFFSLSVSFPYTIEPYPQVVPSSAKTHLHLVFSGLNYQNQEDFLGEINILIPRLLQTKPFDEVKGVIKIWQVKLSLDEENFFFQPEQSLPFLKVRKDFLAGIFKELKENYKLIVINAKGAISCAEFSQAHKTSLLILGKIRYKDENSFAKGFLHELGHSLGLRDEGLEVSAGLSSPGPPNCVISKNQAQKLWGHLVGKDSRVGYILGCLGNKTYFRPTIASLMNNPEKAEDFGPVNEEYLREVLKRIQIR